MNQTPRGANVLEWKPSTDLTGALLAPSKHKAVRADGQRVMLAKREV